MLPVQKWSDITTHANGGYMKNIKGAITLAEKMANREVAGRGDAAGSRAERAANDEVTNDFGKIKQCLDSYEPFYRQPLAQRLLYIPLEKEEAVPTTEAFKTVWDSLECAAFPAPVPARAPKPAAHTHTHSTHTHTHAHGT